MELVVNWSARSLICNTELRNSFAMAALNAVRVRGNPIYSKEECSPFDVGTVFQEIARFSDA